MLRRFLGGTLQSVVGLALAQQAGCAYAPIAAAHHASAYLGCPPEEIEVDWISLGDRAWRASCRGRVMRCWTQGSATLSRTRCTPEPAPAPPAGPPQAHDVPETLQPAL